MGLRVLSYRNIVFLTGAGISTASGLSAFRGFGGLWERFDCNSHATRAAWNAEPMRVWKLISVMRKEARTSRPNVAHLAISHLECSLNQGQSIALVTQNVDGLHQAAGSRNVLELHGRLARTRCSNAGCSLEPFEDWRTYEQEVPSCPLCGAFLRPDVVLFGERIHHYIPARAAVERCDILVSVGTSGLVSPASSFVHIANFAGARTVLVTLNANLKLVSAYQEVYVGPAEEILPALLSTE